jgi:hypothetical protein
LEVGADHHLKQLLIGAFDPEIGECEETAKVGL